MRDLLSRLRLATIRALERAAEFVAGPAAVALHKRARAETFAAWTQLPYTTCDALALRAALGCLVMVARGKESAVGESDTELRDLGMDFPLRELAGRIEASRLLNPIRRVTRETVDDYEASVVAECRRADANKKLYKLACARADDAERRETLALLALRDLLRACERCDGLPAAMATARTLLGETRDEPTLESARPLPVAPDEDEPAIGDLPVVARCPKMRYGAAGQERCVMAVHGGDIHAFPSDETCDACGDPLGDDAMEQGESGMATLCGACVKAAKAEQKEQQRQAEWLSEEFRQR